MKVLDKFLKFWLPVILWTGVIFILSAQPNLRTSWGIWDLILRKIVHITEFAILTFLFMRAFKENVSFKKALILSLVLAFLYAISDEYHQTFISGREGTVRDVLIDSIGILGIGAWTKYKNK